MNSLNAYRQFAVASLDRSKRATDLVDTMGLLIMAQAWFDLAEETNQLVERDTGEARGIMEQPLISATFPRHQRAARYQAGYRKVRIPNFAEPRQVTLHVQGAGLSADRFNPCRPADFCFDCGILRATEDSNPYCF